MAQDTTHKTMHQAGTPVNRSQVAQDTAHTGNATRSTRWTPKSSSTSCDTQIASGPRGSPRPRRRWSTRCPYGGSRTACAREGDTPGTRSGTSEPPRTTVTPYCTRRTWRRPRTPSCRTRPGTLATPNSLSPGVTATSIYGPPRCGCSGRSRSGRRRIMR